MSTPTATKEFSAGGVVSRGGKLLLIRARNLRGEEVWTFPKGHLEAGEGPEEAALREVEEETGWNCRILRPLPTARYRFQRQGFPVAKEVRWYWMAPVQKTGLPDAHEILSARWASPTEAGQKLVYPSDLSLLKAWSSLQ
jgi:ADP-ribose pyrophosphatase YjhB (NUDIX family)